MNETTLHVSRTDGSDDDPFAQEAEAAGPRTTSDRMSLVKGTVAKGFEGVRDAFSYAQAGDEGNAQLCVYRHGTVVVDLWTTRDTGTERPYGPDTIGITMSCTKGMTATCVHLLAQRGLLDLDAPVAQFWPEFAAGGKDAITVSDLISHRGGLLGFDPDAPLSTADLLDWDRAVEALAAMEPLWEPGTAFAYHSLTFGYLAGELVRRVSGRSVGRFLADEVAAPLGLDMWIGLPEGEEYRVAPQFNGLPPMDAAQYVTAVKQLGIDTSLRLVRAAAAAMTVAGTPETLNAREVHAAEIPAANGITNARSLARMYAALIGEVDGVRLLSPETVERARSPQTDGLGLPEPLSLLPDPYPLRFAQGYELHPSAGEPLLGYGSFGHSGAGGRMGFAHPERQTAVGYICTRMAWDWTAGADARWLPWTAALESALC